MATAKRMCSVMGCPLINPEPKSLLFSFPSQNTDRYNRWLMMYPNSFVLRDNGENYICTRHFSAECLDKKRHLKPHADPTRNINTNNAQGQVLETFLTKVIYEWSLRTSASSAGEISVAAMEAANILGMQDFKANQDWMKKFKQIREANLKNGLRFVGDKAEGRQIRDIIRDLRKYLPSNFIIPMDVMDVSANGDQLKVKNECLSDDDTVEVYIEVNSDSDLVDVEKPKIGLIQATTAKEATKKYVKPLDTYQDVLELLKPLEAFITRSGNDKALARVREITTVVKESIETECKPRRGVKRSRSERVM